MTDKTYDIIIGVIASRGVIYDGLVECYWKPFINFVNKTNNKIKVCLLYGNNYNIDDLEINKNNIFISSSADSFVPGILIKTIAYMKYINTNYKYKHFFRTNLSSFIILENLIKIHRKLNVHNVYAGVMCNRNHGFCNIISIFVSGAGFWLSPDNIKFLLGQELNYTIPDDVAVGKIMEKKKRIKLPRLDIVHPNSWKSGAHRLEVSCDLTRADIINILQKSINMGHYHLRIKFDGNRNKDLHIMKIMTERLYKFRT
tara:strand:+ start:2262 stop:3032 length:771 start_codon:yes stop_codon:yes gene_type:complete